MGNSLSLDDLREQLESKYGPVVLSGVEGGDVRLLPVLRLPKDRRGRFDELLRELRASRSGEEAGLEDSLRVVEDLLRLVAETEDQGARLIQAAGGDGQFLLLLFEQYQGATRLGEASPSES